MVKKEIFNIFFKDKSGEKYKIVFWAGFGILLFLILPVLIYNKGIYIYYGDFNAQQIPFYQHAHDAVQQGNFLWDWGTDLGSSLIGSYSFYLLTSPFFLLTIPFPNEAVPYLMGVLLALKYATAGVTAYAFIRRFVRNKDAAMIGALLYAFSGFQAYNIFFNHFHDVVAFFPLLLIALEERVNSNRRGVFALAVGFMAILNYFFFTGQVLFVILYFIARCTSSDFKITRRKFLGLAIEAILGVMMAAVILIPSAMSILGNYRITERLYGKNLFVYSDDFRILRIIQSFFMTPDIPARPNLFSSDSAKWASIGGFLPLFSMAGVIAFMRSKRKHWATGLIIVCIISAFIPLFNSAFYMFNSSYYARWFYMPILIMAFMTAYSLDNRKIDFTSGIKVCGLAIIGFEIIACLPILNKETDSVEWYTLPNKLTYFIIQASFAIISLIVLIILIKKRDKVKNYMKTTLKMTVVMCFLSTAVVFYYGLTAAPYPKPFIENGIQGGENIPYSKEEFYRVDMDKNYDNYPMSWGYSSIRTFHSVVSPSIMEFYDEVGVGRDVASRPDVSEYALRGLLSVKYFFDNPDSDNYNSNNSKVNSELDEDEVPENIKMPGFEYIETINDFDVYENKYFVPMGFTYDHYLSYDNSMNRTKANRSKLMVKAIILDDEQIERYSDIISEISQKEAFNLTEDNYLDSCKKNRENSCHYFEESTSGFKAKIDLDEDKLVFFSVPYDEGFTATVNGVPAIVEKVNYGLMAVRVPAGEDNEIEFSYMTVGLREGVLVSALGALLLLAYMIYNKKFSRKHDREILKNTYYYDYDEEDGIKSKCFYEESLESIANTTFGRDVNEEE